MCACLPVRLSVCVYVWRAAVFTCRNPGLHITWLCFAACSHCRQDLPFSYRFAYTVDDTEASLTAAPQAGNSLKGFYLPAGSDASGGTVGLVVYVSNVWGAVARTEECAYT